MSDRKCPKCKQDVTEKHLYMGYLNVYQCNCGSLVSFDPNE